MKQENTNTVLLRPDGAANVVNVYGTSNADTFDLETDVTTDYNVRVSESDQALAINVWAPAAGTDALNLYGGGAKDTFQLTGDNRAIATRTRIKLFGEEGDDVASLPLVDVVFDGGAGADSLTYTLGSSDSNAFTLTNGRIASPTLSANYTVVSSLLVDGILAAGPFTVQSTHSGTTTLKSGARKTTVTGNSGPLDITTTIALVNTPR